MGKPKFSRKKYETPSHPWQEDRIKSENELIKKYGLKNKREIWKAQTKLRNYRGQARELLAKAGTGDEQSKKESEQLLMSLNRMNVLPAKSTLDDVLALDTESILSRRLQTITYLKGLASTPNQARQLISHGHVSIGGRRVTVPGYIVTKAEEGEIGYIGDSPLNDTMHPARPRSDYKSVPVKREEKPKQKVEEVQVEKKDEQPPTTEAKPETTDAPATPEPQVEEPKEEQTQKPDEATAQEPVEPEKPVEEPPKKEAPVEQPPEKKPSEETKEPEPPAEPKEEQPEKTEDKAEEKKEDKKDEGGN